MTQERTGPRDRLTGRIQQGPSLLLHEEVLEPQFRYEVQHTLTWYIWIESVLLVEYQRMGLIAADEAASIGRLLGDVTPDTVMADPQANMSDIAFALERYVEERLEVPVPAWHVDRSRNDLQACAQLLFGRHQVLQTADALIAFGQAAHRRAAQTTTIPMPGYTHLQSAQVISPGFYLAAVSEQALSTIRRLLGTYDDINRSPLGSGAMAGQELSWDRQHMARLMGFAGTQPHALMGVASREWALQIAADLSVFSVALSRFATDLMLWGSNEYGFIDLPDELSGISSAMPQKKNFPILERIRGKSAHITAFYTDLVLGQRNTPYSNMVEVSKEATAHLLTLFTTARSMLKLFTAVLDHLRFREDRMRDACEQEYLGGFTLANLLTLRAGIPWRKAQVISGQYIVRALDRHLRPIDSDPALLEDVAGEYGFALNQARELLSEAFDVQHNLLAKRSAGSTHPDAVQELLDAQAGEFQRLEGEWARHQKTIGDALAETSRLLGIYSEVQKD